MVHPAMIMQGKVLQQIQCTDESNGNGNGKEQQATVTKMLCCSTMAQTCHDFSKMPALPV
jgi:hypothetical protein